MSQLFSILNEDFELPAAVDARGNILYSAAGYMPTMCWPDGRWCFEANAYLLDLKEKGLLPSTLRTYAGDLSALLRFAHLNRARLELLSDSQFTLFIRSLMAEGRVEQPGVLRRNSNTVCAIGKLSLDFLDWLGTWRGTPGLVGPESQIRAVRGLASAVNTSSHTRTSMHWHHRSFPTADPYKRRRPITKAVMDRLASAVSSASSSMYLRRRRYAMLKLLEITGGRTSELLNLTVSDVRVASRQSRPMLRLNCAKRRGGRPDIRAVPVSRQDIVGLMDFVLKVRDKLIRSTCGTAMDDDFFLVGERTGKGMARNAIAQEMWIIRKAAGILGQACAHMFRHRFATKIFVGLAEHMRIRSKDDFRHVYLSSEKLRTQVSEWLGHLDPSSLDHYVDYAFEEISGFKEVVDVALTRAALDSFMTTLVHMRSELLAGTPPLSIVDRLLGMMSAFGEELGALGTDH